MNRAILIGRLVSDPDMRASATGTTITRYRLAVDRGVKAEGQPTADFISCVAFGKAGDFAGKYLRKGTKVAIEGRIQTGSYEKEDGSKVYTTDIIVDRHEFCESKNAEAAPEMAPSASTEPDSNGFSDVLSLDDIPF